MNKFLFTTDKLPDNKTIKEIFSIVQYTGAVEVSNKGIIRGYLEKNRNEYQEVMDAFINSAPTEANAIIGVQVSTTSQSFKNGTFLYLTYTGTPAIIGDHE